MAQCLLQPCGLQALGQIGRTARRRDFPEEGQAERFIVLDGLFDLGIDPRSRELAAADAVRQHAARGRRRDLEPALVLDDLIVRVLAHLIPPGAVGIRRLFLWGELGEIDLFQRPLRNENALLRRLSRRAAVAAPLSPYGPKLFVS